MDFLRLATTSTNLSFTNRYKPTVAASAFLLMLKSCGLVVTSIYWWQLTLTILSIYVSKIALILAPIAALETALLLQVICDYVMLVGLIKKDLNRINVVLKPSAISFTIECIMLAFLAVYNGLVYGITRNSILLLFLGLFSQMSSLYILIMVKTYYVHMINFRDIGNNKMNVEQVRPKFNILI